MKRYIAKCIAYDADIDDIETYILLESKESDGESQLDIFLWQEDNRLFYNNDWQIKNIEILKCVDSLGDLLEYCQKELGLELYHMLDTKGEIAIGFSDKMQKDLNTYSLDY